MKIIVIVGLLAALTGFFYSNISNSNALYRAENSIGQISSAYSRLEEVTGEEIIDPKAAILTDELNKLVGSLFKIGLLGEAMFFALLCVLPLWGIIQLSSRLADQLV